MENENVNVAQETIEVNEQVENKGVETQEEKKKGVNPAEVLRTLSKKLSVNLFDEEGLSQLDNKLTTKDNELQEALTKTKTYEQELQTLKQQQSKQAFEIEAISLGVDKAKIEDVYVLSKAKQGDLTITESLKKVLEDYPNTFGKKKQTGGVVKNDFQRGNADPNKSEEQRYAEQSPAVKLWNSKNKK